MALAHEGADLHSEQYEKYCLEREVKLIGKCNRYVKQSNKEIFNHSFNMFLKRKNIPKPTKYRMNYSHLDLGYKSFSKYDKIQPNVVLPKWNIAGEWMSRHFLPHMGNAAILDEETVIKYMDKTTSNGYPASLEYHNKTELLNSPAKAILIDFWDVIKDEKPITVPIWTCSQKIEMRPIEKIIEGKIRTFTASPIEQSVACNRLCLDSNERFYSSANKMWSCVGISKFFQGWDSIYTRLNKHPNAFELDESDYDASIFQLALEGQMDFRWSCLQSDFRTPENYNRLRNVYYNIIHSYVVMDNGDLVQKHTGNPSGSSNTIVDNTMVLYRLFAYAFLILAEKYQVSVNYEYFHKHVEAALYGDDNTYTCSNEVVEWFNPTNIAIVWSNVGVTTKTPCDQPRKLNEVCFLSQGFKYFEEFHMYLPVPETEKVLASLLYGSNYDDIRFHLLRACALRMDSWANIECRNIINDYIMWLRSVYKDKLHGTFKINEEVGITMLEIDNAYKTDAFLSLLYTGHEGSGFVSAGHFFKSDILNIDSKFEIYQGKLSMPKKKVTIRVGGSRKAKNPAKAAKKRTKKLVNKILSRKPRIVKGKGEYKSIGGKIGGFIGNGLGHLAQKTLGSIMGFGDYRIRAQSLNMGNGPPAFSGGGDPVITHREYLGVVLSGGTDFTQTRYELNPANSDTFPWLSRIASNYQQYKLLGAVVEFKATSTPFTNVNSGPVGVVIVSTQYDTQRASQPFENRMEMENYEFTTSCAPYESMLHPIECDKRVTPITNRYIKSNSLSGLTDPQFYDWGVVSVATDGLASSAGTQIGELWISYKIQLSFPSLAPSYVPESGFLSLDFTGDTYNPFENVIHVNEHGKLKMKIDNQVPNKSILTFTERGTYLVIASEWRGAATFVSGQRMVTNLVGTGISLNNTYFSPNNATPGKISVATDAAVYQSGYPGGVTVVVVDVSDIKNASVEFTSDGVLANIGCNTNITIVELPTATNSVLTASLVLQDYIQQYPLIIKEMEMMRFRIQELEEEKEDYFEETKFMKDAAELESKRVAEEEKLSESTLLARAIAKLSQ